MSSPLSVVKTNPIIGDEQTILNEIRSGDEPLTVKEVAEMLRISKHWVYKYVHHPDAAQRLPAFQLGGVIRIWRSELDAFIKRAEEEMPVNVKPSVKKRKPCKSNNAKSIFPKIKYDPSKPFRVQDYI